MLLLFVGVQLCEDMSVVAAMTQPGGGRNDIPSRLKRHFFTLSMLPPSLDTLECIYGALANALMRGR